MSAFIKLFESGKGEEDKSVPSVVNCLVKFVSGMVKTIKELGKQLREIVEELKSEKTRREGLMDEIQKKYEEMEKRDRESVEEIARGECDKIEKALDKKVCDESSHPSSFSL